MTSRSPSASTSSHPDDVSLRLRWLEARKRLGGNRQALEAAVAGRECAPHAVALLVEWAMLQVTLGQVADGYAGLNELYDAKRAGGALAESSSGSAGDT
ncbi:hypothetical protein MEX01_51410 [Methylorubrum extorquens]|nr:hypothetical protein MEX01_51410 [Methylorubrum extorquens]